MTELTFTLAQLILISGSCTLTGMVFVAWKTRLRRVKNTKKAWNEAAWYYRVWNPFHCPCSLLFAPSHVAEARQRVKKQPEDA